MRSHIFGRIPRYIYRYKMSQMRELALSKLEGRQAGTAHTPILVAARLQNFEAVKILASCGANLNPKLVKPSAPILVELLKTAEASSNKPIAEYLLKKGCDVDARDVQKGETMLLRALKSANIEYAMLALEYGANYSQEDEFGNTALHIAGAQAATEVVQWILSREKGTRGCAVLGHFSHTYAT